MYKENYKRGSSQNCCKSALAAYYAAFNHHCSHSQTPHSLAPCVRNPKSTLSNTNAKYKHTYCKMSKLLCEDPTTRDQLLKVVPRLQVIGMDQVEILGSPVGSMTSVDVVIKEKIRLLELLGERLRLLQTQDALLLLRHSLAILKVLHVLQSSLCFASTLLIDFDGLLRDILSDIINVCLELGPAWLQVSLPVRTGGVGIRSAAQLA